MGDQDAALLLGALGVQSDKAGEQVLLGLGLLGPDVRVRLRAAGLAHQRRGG